MESVSCSQQGTDLAFILNSISVACKVISNAVTMAGIQSLHALEGGANATGDDQKTLDVLSNDVMINALRSSRKVGAMVSEEDPEAMIFTDDVCAPGVKYALVFDPLDGSSNIECNVSVGTIFGVYKCVDSENPSAEDCMQSGSAMICAGYVLYSSACIMVISTGLSSGVHSFTIDPTFGEFVESSTGPIKIPENGGKRIYSVNAGNSELWDLPTSEFVRWTKRQKNRYSLRYIGSMVADVHRTLLYGGIFMYPADFQNRSGKLRLIYECFPMAFLVEAAGGMASTGTQRILDLKPKSIHERAPIFIGCKRDVMKVEELYSRIPKLYGMHFSPLDERSTGVVLEPAKSMEQNERKLEHPTSPTRPRSRTASTSRSRTGSVEPPSQRIHWAVSVANYTLLAEVHGDPDRFELSGKEGDTFTEVYKMNDPKWVMATSVDNERGLIPTRLLSAAKSSSPAPNEIAVASFVGDAENYEIDFQEGDKALAIRHCNDARWCYAKNERTGASGIVPASLFPVAGNRKRFSGEEVTRHLKVSPKQQLNNDSGSDDEFSFPLAGATRVCLTDRFDGDLNRFELSGGKGTLFTNIHPTQDEGWICAKDKEGREGLLPTKLLTLATSA